MPFTPFSFDESVAQTEPGRPHVPEGYYLLTKVRIEPTPEDYEKTTGVFTTFRFKEGPSHAPDAGRGREMRDYATLGAGVKNGRGSQFGFGMMLGAMGHANVAKRLAGTKMDSYGEFKGLIEAIDQRTGEVDVVALIADQAGNNGRPFSSIEEYLPASEWANVKGSSFAAVAPRPTNGTAASAPAPVPTQSMDALKAKAAALFE